MSGLAQMTLSLNDIVLYDFEVRDEFEPVTSLMNQMFADAELPLASPETILYADEYSFVPDAE